MGVDRPLGPDGEVPVNSAGPLRPKTQHVVVVQERLKGRGECAEIRTGRSLYDHGLVEPVGGAAGPGEPVHDRGRRQIAGPRAQVLCCGVGCVVGIRGDRGERLDRPVLEDVARREDEPGCTGAADELDGDDAVATELEEAVVDADAVETEDVGEKCAEGLFTRVTWPAAGGPGVEVGKRQRLAIQLPVRGQGKLVERDERRGDHVVGQDGGHMRAQQVGVEGLPGGRDGVGDQTLDARLVLPDQDGGLRDRPVRGQRGLDLTEFDPESADLDLVVRAPVVLQLAVDGPAHDVAGAVHPRTRGTEGAGHEALG
ncbi:hypothetical protein A3Q37_07119 [Streptomyces sp. PTY087I2]|nr:hypothetical protein A3Q37_07119 [Streptomyces sp. PTY087I2]